MILKSESIAKNYSNWALAVLELGYSLDNIYGRLEEIRKNYRETRKVLD